MLCKYPQPLYSRDRDTFRGCGQCSHCRVNIRREKKTRIMLESKFHPCNSFLTLTYDDDHLPADLSVSKVDHQEFIEPFALACKRKFGRKLRYFMAAEYGEQTERPHYHYILFGYPDCPYGGGRWLGTRFVPCSCPSCDFIKNYWSYGNIFLGSLTTQSAEYCAGYVTKKMTSDQSEYQEWWLSGRAPEFSLCSRRPGLAAEFVDILHHQLTRFDISDPLEFPRSINVGREKLPLGRYLSEKLKTRMGIVYDPSQRKRALQARMPLMSVDHADFSSVFAPDSAPSAILADASVAAVRRLLNSQRCVNAEAITRLYRKEKKL